MSIILKIPAWLAKTEKLTTILTGEVLRETPKALYIKGSAKIMPSQNCLRCGREITNPVFRVVGIGPECCAKLGIARPDYSKAVELQKQLEVSTAFERWFPKSQVTIDGEYKIVPQVVKPSRIYIESKVIKVSTVADNKDLCKSVQGYKWNPDSKVWEYPIRVGIAKQLIDAFSVFGVSLTIDDSIVQLTDEVVTTSTEVTNKLFSFQLEGVRFLMKYKRALLADDMGCIDGEALVNITYDLVASDKITIRELYLRWKTSSEPIWITGENKNILSRHKILNVISKGYMETLRITTLKGHQLILTPDHEILTPGGWKAANTLKVGSLIHTNGISICEYCGLPGDIITYKYSKFRGCCKKCMYSVLRENGLYGHRTLTSDGVYLQKGLTNHPYRTTAGVYEHRLVYEAYLNNMDLLLFIETIHTSKDLSSYIFLPPDIWIHHKDSNRFNNDLSNLQVVTTSEHSKIHNVINHIQHMKVDVDTIIQIENVGLTEVYDITVEDIHNFIANGIVVHNCGKTIQAIVASTQIGKKILVVCPASLKRNWQREFHFWTPEWKVQIIDGTPKQKAEQMASTTAKVFICSWEMLRLGAKIENKHLSTRGPELTKLERMKFDVCIMDEAHKIKNRKAIVTKCAADLAKFIPYVFPLTGTPMMNAPQDLYSILNVLAPTEFKSYWKFVEKYCTVVKDDYGYVVGGLRPGMEGPLKTLLEQLVLRRTKGEVLTELPAKMIQKFICPLEGKQLKTYTGMADDMYTKWEGQVVSATVVIAQITRLKQIVIDPTLMMEEHDNNPLQGAKIDALLDIVEGLGDQKVVIFSQFAKACKRLKITLEGQGYTGVILTGDMNSKQRDDSVQSFQQDLKCKFIIVSTLAGGTGLTLTAASTAIFMDKYWTPAINIQAQDRLHRIGQRSSVNIIELLAENTVEDAIEELLKYKYEQFQSLFSTDEVVTNQTKVKTRDLMALFNKR